MIYLHSLAYFIAEIYDHVVIDGARPKIPSECPPQLAELIKKCWDSDPAKRPTFQQIIDSHVLDEGSTFRLFPVACSEGR